MVLDDEGSKNGDKCVFERKTVKCVDQIGRFSKEGGNYYKQLACLYTARLDVLSKVLADQIPTKWGILLLSYIINIFIIFKSRIYTYNVSKETVI